MRVETFAPVYVIEPKDYGSAGIDGDSFTAGQMNSVSIFIGFGTLTGNSTLTVYNGATVGAKTTAIAFKYRLSAAAYKTAVSAGVGPDQLGDATSVTSAGLVLTAATFNHKYITIEFQSDALTDGQPWITISIDATATALNVGAFAIGAARFPGHLIPTVN